MSGSMCILFRGTNQKDMLQNEMKDLIFEVSNLSIAFFFKKIISYEGPKIYDIHTERRWGGLKICCMFASSFVFKQQIYCSFLRMGVGAVKEVVIFGGRHNCMVPVTML